jgi:outer membrane receptor protein involved in Fe transport
MNEMITIGGFYKNFNNPIEQRITPGAGDDKRSVYYANLVDATSIGGEIEIRSSLSNLGKLFGTKALDKFSVVANAAYIHSEITEVPDTADSFVRDKKRAMQGQSPYIVNAGLFYENADMGLMANIVYNIIGERIVTVGDPGRPHVVEKPRNLLDFTIAKKIGTKWEVRFGIDDLLNQPVELVQRIRVSVPSENGSGEEQVDEVEKIYTSYKPGTKFSFGVSLKF